MKRQSIIVYKDVLYGKSFTLNYITFVLPEVTLTVSFKHCFTEYVCKWKLSAVGTLGSGQRQYFHLSRKSVVYTDC